MAPTDLWAVRQAAADRRSALRSAFIRNDPQLTGKIAPFLVQQIISANRVDVGPDFTNQFRKNGRFYWQEFCTALEKELAVFMNREGYALGGPQVLTPRRPMSGIASPRQMPALLRTNVPLSPRAHPMAAGLLTGSPRPLSAIASPRLPAPSRSPRALKEVRMQRIRHLDESVSNAMASFKYADAASNNPWLLSRAARELKVAPQPEAPPGDMPRLMASLQRVRVTPRRGGRSPRSRTGGDDHGYGPSGGDASAYGDDPAGGEGGMPAAKVQNKTVSSITDKIAASFTNIRKAFQYIDVDGNGKLDKNEIKRAMDMWNLPINGAHLHELFAACDADANGTIDYNEFVDNLARDTVAPAAMGKRGTQTGADDQEMMEVMLGHVKHKNFALPEFAGVQKALTRADIVAMGKEKEAKAVKDQAMNQLNLHFTNMRKAFHFVDVDNSGTVDAAEIRRAMHLWGVDLDDETLNLLMAECDSDGDGQIEYNEFIDHLARDTVMTGAMGKRGMQSKDAVGEDAFELLNEMLGHKKVKNYKMPGLE